MMAETRDPPDEDTLRILLATDIHLGCFEKDEIRGGDSFRAFNEILQLANDNKVDFVLLGGDLFHENKPSRSCIFKACQMIEKHCLGNREMTFDVVSDQSVNFPTTGCVNYEDPAVNISMPIFSIHGNHDDPSGAGNYATLDILSVCKLVNYFGKAENVNDITVFPILFKKGKTSFALYGLGAIMDERLHRTFDKENVKWVRPGIDKDDWFNMFVIHQNRTRHTQHLKNCIPEEMLPQFLDLVMWGHEHESILSVVENLERSFYITQPGSSVHTSLCQGEAVKKHVGLLEICGGDFRIVPLPLETVRPFVIQDVVLDDHLELDVDKRDIEDFLISQVNDMIKKVGDKHPELQQDESKEDHASKMARLNKIPLIRLRVDHTGFERINNQRFGQNFVGKVANPLEILKYSRQKASASKSNHDQREFFMQQTEEEKMEINDFISKNLGAEKPLEILVEQDLTDAVRKFVDKKETHAIEEFVKEFLVDIQQRLAKEENLNKADIPNVVERHTKERRKYFQDKLFTEETKKRKKLDRSNSAYEDEHEEPKEDSRGGRLSPKAEPQDSRFEQSSKSVDDLFDDGDLDVDVDVDEEKESQPRKSVRQPKKRSKRLRSQDSSIDLGFSSGSDGDGETVQSSQKSKSSKRPKPAPKKQTKLNFSQRHAIDLAADSDDDSTVMSETSSQSGRPKRKLESLFSQMSATQSQARRRRTKAQSQNSSQDANVSTKKEMKPRWGGARRKRK